MCLNKSGGALKYQPAKCCKIVYVCCQSHNICVDMKLPVFDDPEDAQIKADDEVVYQTQTIRHA